MMTVQAADILPGGYEKLGTSLIALSFSKLWSNKMSWFDRTWFQRLNLDSCGPASNFAFNYVQLSCRATYYGEGFA